MALTGHEHDRNYTAQHTPELQAKLSTLFALAAAPVALLFLLVPRDVLFPAASALCLLLAFATSIYAWRNGAHYRSHRLTFWDLAGAFALIGFGAGALTESNAALQLFGMARGG
jgi:O-antigen/teichoic acid export membrane protein